MSANSRCRISRSACSPESRHDQFMAERRQDCFEGDQVGGVVVDDQNAGAELGRLVAVVPGRDPLFHCASFLVRHCSWDALTAPRPQANEVQKFFGVDRLRQVVGRAGFQALLRSSFSALAVTATIGMPRKIGLARIARMVS